MSVSLDLDSVTLFIPIRIGNPDPRLEPAAITLMNKVIKQKYLQLKDKKENELPVLKQNL
jgi:hypothetical protein